MESVASYDQLATCIMPTANRRQFVPGAIRCFLSQDYANKELVILDDGRDSVADLIPDNPQIHYRRIAPDLSLGAKRNACVEAGGGEIVLHWDDDDWHAPRRISYQVAALAQSGAAVCGLNTLLFYDIHQHRAWKYAYPLGQRPWLSGSSLCYRRAFWEQHPFPAVDVGEDARFVWSGRPEELLVLDDHTFHVGFIHGANTAPKATGDSYWHPFSEAEIGRLLGDAWPFSGPAAANGQEITVSPTLPTRRRETMTVAYESDLQLPEFAAFNDGQELPRMRRWELPFALFQARLDNTMAVLDCTINPAGFGRRLGQLYPHVSYCHWNPIQRGEFALPAGLPDNAFDRIFCVNTIEHLVKPQRETLVAALARKLKPGGLLLVTSDYYFDYFWETPALHQMGVMNPQRTEIFNGWNKVAPGEWLRLAEPHGLQPLLAPEAEPEADDPRLYRNLDSYPHACIGGVFVRGEQPAYAPARKIVLALLTWNTREISLESLRAYERQGQMLRRLGHEPLICVCDNGSSDGSAEALRELAETLDVPVKLIFNGHNAGNSIARNHIIDYFLEVGGDYLLFMDGDIEIVPFSSFAMMRHLELWGSQLGCIGADSAGQTPERHRASRTWYAVDPARIDTTNLVAWTQYGMFRREVFEAGVRFDETHPFDGPGWGFEDNDLAFQMEMEGFLNQRYFGMVYLHRALHSSVEILKSHNLDAAQICKNRKQFVIDKWARVPEINNGPLGIVRRISPVGW